MKWPGQDRWQKLWHAAGAHGDPSPWYHRLTQAYAEPHRHYHNQLHIAECLAEFDAARNLAHQPEAVEFALWFHDAIYDPRAADNEEQSAALARECLLGAQLTQLAETVSALVMATKLHGSEAGPDVALMVDVDLSILGKDDSRFKEYEAQIRREYEWVPQSVFCEKRAEILERFLARKRIYATDYFFGKYEQSARQNLERSIRDLRSQR